MALRTKNKRRITIGETVFYWTLRHLYPEDILRLTVMTDEKSHSRLVCRFNYTDVWLSGLLANGERCDDPLLLATGGVLTPGIVRQIVDYALQSGWQPSVKGKDFVIGENEVKIDPVF